MAMTFETDRTQTGARSTGAGIVVVADRRDDFRKARSHSRTVRVLRVVFPAIGIAILGFYGMAVLGTGGITSSLPQVSLPRITPQDLSMQNPNYDGVTEDGGTYRVAAARARQDFKQTDIVELEEITGDLFSREKSKTTLTATRGTFNHKKNILDLKEKIEIRSEDGLSADLTQARVLTKSGLITSKEPVRVGFPAGTVRSRELTIRQKEREVTFLKEVVARLNPPERKPDDGAAVAAQSAANPLFSGSQGPVDITAARLDVQDAKKIAIFTGNVQAKQAEATLETPEMTVYYEGEAQPSGGVAAAGGKVRRIDAKGPFVMTRGATDRVTGDSSSFDVASETAVLEGRIVITAVPDRRVTADRVDLDQRADSALLTGNVVVVNGETVLKGRRLFVDRKNGRTSMTSPPMSGSGPGRIAAHFVQPKPEAKKPEAAPKKSSGGVADFRTSPDAPLDIDADSLDVDDNGKVAVFRGDVVARQGEVTMRSAAIRAYYSGSARLADISGEPEGAKAKQAEGTALTRIETEGKVTITTADGRRVNGDWAKYDAKANAVTVGGDVELFQGSSVVRGSRLLIDMVTGKATIDTVAPEIVAQPAGGGWSTDAEAAGRSTSGRPSAIFFPNELRNSQGGAAGRKPGTSGASGWSSETVTTPRQ
jgi:LPS export ABC transporter protein LptC/lipopolysaccharide transport protein LptA